MGPQILENVERVLKRDGARAVTIDIVWEPMWTPYAMSDTLKRQFGLLDEVEPEEPEEPEPLPELPPPLPKKKGLLSRLFG
jgi:metal-sulfur cluster biosynthetic enzyme